MFTRDRVDTTRAEQPGGISPAVHSVLAVYSSKEPRPGHDGRERGINISGVDFWHAVKFSRNGRFLCTHPLGLSSGQFPFGLAFPTLSDPFGPDSLSAGPFDIHYVSRFPRQLIIEFREFEFGRAGTPKSPPLR